MRAPAGTWPWRRTGSTRWLGPRRRRPPARVRSRARSRKIRESRFPARVGALSRASVKLWPARIQGTMTAEAASALLEAIIDEPESLIIRILWVSSPRRRMVGAPGVPWRWVVDHIQIRSSSGSVSGTYRASILTSKSPITSTVAGSAANPDFHAMRSNSPDGNSNLAIPRSSVDAR